MVVALPQGVRLTPLRIVPTPGGPVYHGIKASDSGYAGFGEAYFTTVEQGAIKAWRMHHRMLSNLIVPAGSVRLRIIDDRDDSATRGRDLDIVLGPQNYQRLTVPPGLWLGFQGVGSGLNLMLNLASIAHDPSESETLPPDHPRFQHYAW